MDGLFIAIIVVVAVVFALLLIFIADAMISFSVVLGRKTFTKERYDNLLQSYNVDMSWFEDKEIETLRIKSYDGIELCAEFIKNGDSKKIAILQHGYHASASFMQQQAQIFYDRGYSVLLPYLRAHGKSGGTHSGMAWFERFDLQRWIKRAKELGGVGSSIVLLGVSMGASAVVGTLAIDSSDISCAIVDCGFSSQVEQYKTRLFGPRWMRALLLKPFAFAVRLRQGYSIKDADIKSAAQSVTVPTLFICGKDDKFVPPSHTQQLFDACASDNKKLVWVENARHARSVVTDKQLYEKSIDELLAATFDGANLNANEETKAENSESVAESEVKESAESSEVATNELAEKSATDGE